MANNIIFNGANAKIMQYDPITIPEKIREKYNIKLSEPLNESDTLPIKINDSLTKIFNKKVSDNVIIINILKDKQRYKNTIEELKKLKVNNFVHLVATYWKEKNKMENDLNFVINFLHRFNKLEESPNIKINQFSEISDPNITIQDGPLACYISHLRAMIYGYTNFDDYTIIVEDDIDIKNTSLIEKCLNEVPDDWDIILFNSCPKHVNYGDKTMYKFINEFHSLHFYIIKNSSYQKIFKKLYPVTDQVDVLVSNCFSELNCYNISGKCVMQKNISTNTQNNLHIIYNSPHYHNVRKDVSTIKYQIMSNLQKKLIDNCDNNKFLCIKILFDVVFSYVDEDFIQLKDYEYKNTIKNNIKLEIFYDAVLHFLYSVKKGSDIAKSAENIIGRIIEIINMFNFHGKEIIINNKLLKLFAYSYGTSYDCEFVLYKCSDYIIKQYVGNDVSLVKKAFDTDMKFQMEKQNNSNVLIGKYFNPDNNMIIFESDGNLLMEKWNLPVNYEEQIKNYNVMMNNDKITVNNVIIENNKLLFFNISNCEKNIINILNVLNTLNTKYQNLKSDDIEHRYVLYKIFCTNIETKTSL